MQAPTLHDIAFPERARQDREIVYFLNPPETHSFRLYHDYTESKEGVARYVNLVRGGSKVSEPSARLLDTGKALETETLAGERARKAGLLGDDADPDAEVVVIHFPAVKKGRTKRIRIEETYTDPSRYGLVGERLVWRRSFGRPLQRRRASRRLVSDEQLDPGDRGTRRRWTRPTFLRKRKPGRHRRSVDGSQALIFSLVAI